MTSNGCIDRLVKARWLAIGLSQTDLAEVLDAASQQTQKDSSEPPGVDARRLLQVAEALDISLNCVHAVKTEPEPAPPSTQDINSLQSLLELRLLRAFHELRDDRAKRMLVHLAERTLRRQANRCDDAG
jgi:transcriptional regulator with XRE-family HTH domain